MKLKYYLRGVGIGVVVTTIILTIAFSIRIQDNPGTIATEASTSNLDNILNSSEAGSDYSTENTIQATTEATIEATTEITTEAVTERQQAATQIVARLDDFISSEQVCSYLTSIGVIQDATDFNNYLAAHGYSEKIWPQTYTITVGSDYETIARIICGLQ